MHKVSLPALLAAACLLAGCATTETTPGLTDDVAGAPPGAPLTWDRAAVVNAPPGPLEPMPALQSTASDASALLLKLQAMFGSLEAAAGQPDAAIDLEFARDAGAVSRYAHFLIAGPDNPYSLAKLASGEAVALAPDELQLVEALLEADGELSRLASAGSLLDGTLAALPDRVVLAAAVEAEQPSSAWLSKALMTPGSTPAPIRVRTDEYNNLVDVKELRDARPLTGLDRAQSLMAMLATGRAIKNTQIFLNYSTQVESATTVAVERLVNRVWGGAAAGPLVEGAEAAGGDASAAKLARIMKAYGLAKLSVQLTTAAMSALAAVSPQQISGFYMTLSDRKYQENAPPYPLAVDEQVVGRIYVVPYAPGDSVITPIGVVSLVVDAGLGPGASKAFDKLTMGTTGGAVYKEMFNDLMKTLGKFHVDTAVSVMNNYGLSSWASSLQNSISIPGKNLKPVEINDDRVVKLTPGAHVTIAKTADSKYAVRGASPGDTSIAGSLLTPALAQDAASASFRIAVAVGARRAPLGPPPTCSQPMHWPVREMVNGQEQWVCVFLAPR